MRMKFPPRLALLQRHRCSFFHGGSTPLRQGDGTRSSTRGSLLNRFKNYFESVDREKGPAPGLRSKPSTTTPLRVEKKRIPGVQHVIAVASGKGGVGKSTTAVNLAVAMAQQQQQLRVGILDADLYGPSLPRMMNLRGGWKPETTERGLLRPLQNYGIQCMSMGFLVREEDAVVWRGLMVMKALQQLLFQVDWGELDVLVVDMPPGTGDTQLTVGQHLQLSGAVIVSTPQEVALGDVRKGITMFEKVQVPILGIIENMSFYHCPQCHHEAQLFGKDGAKRVANESGMEFLGGIPLDIRIRETSDEGRPVALASQEGTNADAVASRIYHEIATKIWTKLKKVESTAAPTTTTSTTTPITTTTTTTTTPTTTTKGIMNG